MGSRSSSLLVLVLLLATLPIARARAGSPSLSGRNDWMKDDNEGGRPRCPHQLAQHMRGSFLPSRSSEPRLRSIATRDDDGLAVLLTNELEDRDLELDLALAKDGQASRPVVVRVDAGLAVLRAVALPRNTTTLLTFDREGRALAQYTYSRRHDVENRPPDVTSLFPEAGDAPAIAGYRGTPFGDARNARAPQRIPGRLQCELYDVGGPGVAYSDSDGVNSGSGALNPLDGSYLHDFRAGEAVDTSFTKDIGVPTQDFSEFDKVVPDRDALYLGWTAPGEWVNYTVHVEKPGACAVDVMYTSNGEGRFELRVDGTPRGTVVLPTTHDDADPVAWRQWHHWNKVVSALALDLAPGLHVVQIRFLAGNTNLDYLEFRPR